MVHELPTVPTHGPQLLAVMGPTASGKSQLAEEIATSTGAQLINADAFQIYRHLSIGTGKPEDWQRYEMINIREPNEEFSVGEYIQAVLPILERCFGEKRDVILVGGTGYYIRALLEGYTELFPDPPAELRAELNSLFLERGISGLVERLKQVTAIISPGLDLKNPVRVQRAIERALSSSPPLGFQLPAFSIQKIAISPLAEVSDQLISGRVEKMMQNGWVEEVKSLIALGFGCDDPGFRAIGYRTIFDHLVGNPIKEDRYKGILLAEVTKQVVSETIRYAKRQRTWLRKEPNLKSFENLPSAFSWVKENIINFGKG